LPPPQSDLAQQLVKDPYNFDFLTLGTEIIPTVEQLEIALESATEATIPVPGDFANTDLEQEDRE